MSEEMNRLVELLESVPDSYEDFVLGTSLMAHDSGVVGELINFIEANPGAESSSVLDWLFDKLQLKPVVTINGLEVDSRSLLPPWVNRCLWSS